MPVLQKVINNGKDAVFDSPANHSSMLVFGVGDLVPVNAYGGESSFGKFISLHLAQLNEPVEVGTKVQKEVREKSPNKASLIFHNIHSIEVVIEWLELLKKVAIDNSVFEEEQDG